MRELNSRFVSDEFRVSRWETMLVNYFTLGQVAEPSMVYYMIRRRMRRRNILKRPEFLVPLALTLCLLIAYGTGSRGSPILAGMVGLFVWSVWLGYAPLRLMILRGELQELLITPIGVARVLADIRVLYAKPLIVSVFVLNAVCAVSSKKDLPIAFMLTTLFQAPWLLFGGTVVGSRIALRTITLESVAAASASRLRRLFAFVYRAVLWVMIPIVVFLYLLSLLARVSFELACIVGPVVALIIMIPVTLHISRKGRAPADDSSKPIPLSVDTIDL